MNNKVLIYLTADFDSVLKGSKCYNFSVIDLMKGRVVCATANGTLESLWRGG